MTENEISYIVIGAAIKLHKTIGSGLLESVYENCLAYDLKELGLDVKQQLPIPLIYKGVNMEEGFRLDLLINELKSVKELIPVHFATTLTYLRLSCKKLGLLMNFNSKILKENIHRIVNNL
jgi:GxxExxY protein